VRNSGVLDIYEKLRLVSGGRILDIGTQKGHFIGTLKKSLNSFESITGIDISEEDLEKAQENHRDDQTNFLLMNAENLDFEDESFDTVSISYSIHHLENPRRVFQEMYRVLKPNGHLLLQEMFCDGNQTDSQRMDMLVHHWDAKIDSLLGIPHFETLSRVQLRDLVSSVNFSHIELFEATRDIGCIFCNDMQRCENPMNFEIIDGVIKDIDGNLEKMIDHPSYEELKAEADELKEKVHLYGSSSASSLFFICRK